MLAAFGVELGEGRGAEAIAGKNGDVALPARGSFGRLLRDFVAAVAAPNSNVLCFSQKVALEASSASTAQPSASSNIPMDETE
jgi:hypothetical protein